MKTGYQCHCHILPLSTYLQRHSHFLKTDSLPFSCCPLNALWRLSCTTNLTSTPSHSPLPCSNPFHSSPSSQILPTHSPASHFIPNQPSTSSFALQVLCEIVKVALASFSSSSVDYLTPVQIFWFFEAVLKGTWNFCQSHKTAKAQTYCQLAAWVMMKMISSSDRMVGIFE